MAQKSVAECFRNLGKKPCMKKWRIQQDKLILKPQPKGNVGTFYAGDCYIILKIWQDNHDIKKDLHVWIGSEVGKEDEINAFERASDTDDILVDGVTMYRQVQNHETREFLDLFPNGVKYFEGTCGQYKHFENGQYVKRLFHIKGKRNVRINQVHAHYGSLNKGDTFVLDDEWTIYCWNGSQSSKVERIKAIEVAQRIRDDLCFGKADIIVADEDTDIKEEHTFFKMLGSRGNIKPANNKDDDYEGGVHTKPTHTKLFRVSDESGNIKVLEIKEKPLTKNVLNSQDCFIVDGGQCEIFVWVGRRCTNYEKREANKKVVNFITENGYPKWTPITRILEGEEPKMFKMYFDKWQEKSISVEKGHIQITDIDVMQSYNEYNTQEEMMDNAKGPIKVWRIEGFKKVPWPVTSYGIFYEGDSYIIQYTNLKLKKHVIYVWQGKSSCEEEKDNAMYFAEQLDNTLKGKSIQVRVVHGKEPEHFLRMFKGKLIILMGGIDSEKANESNEQKNTDKRDIFQENDNKNKTDIRFFHIKGNTPLNTRAVQIPVKASLLKSEDAFLLQTDGINYIWEGSMASDEEKDFAEVAADRIAPDGDLVIFQEGYESQAFWQALNGKTRYNNDRVDGDYTKNMSSKLPRLYHCSNETGKFEVKEVIPFDQKDLNGDDVMILDTYNEIFVWIGKEANKQEKRGVWETAKNFIEADANRSFDNTVIVQVKQGNEPKSFSTLFNNWDEDLAQGRKSYSALRKEIKIENKMAKSKSPRKARQAQGEHRVISRAAFTPAADNKNVPRRGSQYQGFLVKNVNI